MGLFALSVLIGCLIACIDIADPTMRSACRDWVKGLWPALFFVLLSSILVGGAVYLWLWLDYYDVAAPSLGFRRFTFFKRAIEYAPLMLAAAAVGFASIHWLRRAKGPSETNIVSHGIGVAGTGLLVVSLFMFQDPRIASLLQKVNTPVFSLEFTRTEETRGTVRLTDTSGGHGLLPAATAEPVSLALYALSTLDGQIKRDLDYVKFFAPSEPAAPILASIERERLFYLHTLQPLSKCLIAIRARVLDADPIVFIDHELPRTLRLAHRVRLFGTPSEFREEMFNFVRQLRAALDIIEKRKAQHRRIEPPLREEWKETDLDSCNGMDTNLSLEVDGTRGGVVWHLHAGGFGVDTPYFSLVVAALLIAMNERLAAVEEIDAWLKYQGEQAKRNPPGPKSAAVIAGHLFRLRTEFWAGEFLVGDQRYVNLALRRYHQLVQSTDRLFTSDAPGVKWKMPLEKAIRQLDTRNPSSFCTSTPWEPRRLLFTAFSAVNAVINFAIVNDLRNLDNDYEDYIRKYHDQLAYLDLNCVSDFEGIDEVGTLAEFTDTYLIAKRSILRDLPQERARSELCKMAKALERADYYSRELERQAGTAGGVLKAEEKLEPARSLKRSVRIFNDALQKAGARSCLLEGHSAQPHGGTEVAPANAAAPSTSNAGGTSAKMR